MRANHIFAMIGNGREVATGSSIDCKRGIPMKFTKTALIASAAAMSLGLAACDGPQEEAMEDQAEAMESELDAQAEAMEDAGAPEEAVEAMEDKADAVEDAGEEAADEMDGM